METARSAMQSGRRQHVCASAPRLSRSQAGAAASLICLLLAAPLPAQTAAPLPVLRTARQVHTLSAQEAAQGYPVHLARAQITYYQPSFGAAFLMDATDGIYANLPQGTPPDLHPGDVVAVDGISGPGDVAPVIRDAHFRILSHAPLPEAPLVGFDRLSSGAFDSRWVSVEGIVRSADRPRQRTDYDGVMTSDKSNVLLTLASGEERLEVITLDDPAWDPQRLVDARVRLRAAVGARFNQRKQLIGVHLYMPNRSMIQVLDPAPADPFSLPLTTITGITRIGAGEPGHRVHIRGIVTSASGDRNFSVMDARHGIFVTTAEPTVLKPGDQVDVAGFPSIGDYTDVLESSVVRRIGSAPIPAPVRVTPTAALAGAWDAEPIEVEGVLTDRRSGPNGSTNLRLTEAGVVFHTVIPAGISGLTSRSLQLGSRLRVRGICIVHTNFDKKPQSFDVLLRSPADVVLLQRPSWWTAHNTLRVALVLALLVLVAAAWNLLLRRRVRSQTRTIRQQLDEAETLRRQAEAAHKEKSDSLASVLSLQRELIEAQKKLRYQATHDALTGLWNRRALLDLLEKELERCCRTNSSMGILMLDVDHFKPVNDSLGHLAGDEVLKEVAHRIANATRGYDLSGRYGGEEFLIILPGCDREQTEASAERIRSAVSSTPIEVANTAIALTVSIGATVAPEYARSESEILALADIALYQAKASGRNRTSLRRSFREDRAEA
ncbi:MAG: GGDEF domain-containing protein [Acidobacteriota bacterium]